MELQRLSENAVKARRLCNEIVSSRKISNAINVLARAQEIDIATRDRLKDLLRFASEHELVERGQPLRLSQSMRLVATTVENATHWVGSTHWSMLPVSREKLL